MSEWPTVPLKPFCEKIGSGATPRGGSSVYMDTGEIALVRSQNIYNDRFEPSGLVYISEEAAEKLSNVELESGDVLLNITGDSVARVSILPDEFLPARVNQHVAIIRVNRKEFDHRFVRYFLAAPTTQDTLLSLASAGATRNALTKGMIEEFEVPKPTLAEQKKIADILTALDDKIALNRKLNETLEGMARALFQSWFVDFDPVKAKFAAKKVLGARQQTPSPQTPMDAPPSPQTPLPRGEGLIGEGLIEDDHPYLIKACMAALSGKLCIPPGKPKPGWLEKWSDSLPSTSGRGAGGEGLACELDDAIAALGELPATAAEALAKVAAHFPSDFQESELGLIPEGWEVSGLGKYLDIKRGGSPRPIHDFLSNTGLPWVKIADATGSTSRFLFETKQFIKSEGLRKTVLLKKGSLILSNSATPGLPMFLDIDACIHDGWLHFPKIDHFTKLYLYQLFLVIREELVGKGNGSVFTNLKTDILRSHRVSIPCSKLILCFDEILSPIFFQIYQLNHQSRTLAELRDTLLPKLLSGELTVGEAETKTEEALA